MAAGKYNFRKHKKGDALPPVTMTVSENSVGIDLTNVPITLMLKRQKSASTAVLTWEVGSGITLTDAVNGEFKIDPGVVNIPAGTYYYDIEFGLDAGVTPTTLIEGVLIVEQDVTDTPTP